MVNTRPSLFSPILQEYTEICRGAVVIMSPPQDLGIRPPNKNGHHGNDKEAAFYQEFNRAPEAFRQKALEQWEALKSKYEHAGLNVITIPPRTAAMDHTFTADPFIALRNDQDCTVLFLKSYFTNQARGIETLNGLTMAWQKHLPDHDVHMDAMRNAFEGTGDCLYDPARNVFWAGYAENPDPQNPGGGRSSKAAHAEFHNKTGATIISLELQDGCFHVDTCLSALPTGHLLVYKDGMTPRSFEILRNEAFSHYGLDEQEFLIEVSRDDAKHNFATNLVCAGKTIFMPVFGEDVAPTSPELIQKLENIGYDVHLFPYGQMIKVGGAIHCTSQMVAPLIPEGLLRRHHPQEATPEKIETSISGGPGGI